MLHPFLQRRVPAGLYTRRVLRPAAPVNILQTFTFAISVEAIPFYKKKAILPTALCEQRKKTAITKVAIGS